MNPLLQAAVAHHMAGRFAQAEAAYRQVLERQPVQPEAFHLLGLLYLQDGRPDMAADFISRAVEREPRVPDYRNHLGLAFAERGRFAEAEEQFRRAIELRPEFTDAHNGLGNVLKEQGKAAEAEQHYRKVLALDPSHAAAHNNLGAILADRGSPEEALVHYNRAIELEPGDADTHLNLGNVLRALGRPEEAIGAYRNAIAGRSNLVEAHLGLGVSLQDCGQLDAAIASYNDALAIDPQSVDGHNALALVMREAGKPKAAIAHFRAALSADPARGDIHYNLGTVLWESGLIPEAVAVLKRAVALRPDDAAAHTNLGGALNHLGDQVSAEAALRKALTLQPQQANAHLNLGNVLSARGRSEDAVTAYRRALTLDPTLDIAYSNLLLTLHYCTGVEALEMRREHERWAAQRALPLARHIEPHVNDPIPTRRLRIGYLSPDFRTHSVAAFIEPVLAAHDTEAFEIFCYANVRRPDAVTERLRGLGYQWRFIAFASDADVVAQVRDDRVDILVDLAGHTSKNRLLVFARKPAPIQVTYLGYPDTTGLDAIDYRLTDALADPPGKTEAFYCERLIRLPQGFLCYRPSAETLTVGRLPAQASGCVTFGSFNNIAKVNDRVIDCWAKILTALPDARLILKARAIDDAETRGRLVSLFAERDVSAERLELMGWVPESAAHVGLYNRVDIALDTFPYNGTTTTCEALWMGVPVITLAGQAHAGRVGVSLLTHAGLPELIAESPEHYVDLTVTLASDLEHLGDLRQGLRAHLKRSALMDAVGLTRSIESAYREMWKRYCEDRDQRDKIEGTS